MAPPKRPDEVRTFLLDLVDEYQEPWARPSSEEESSAVFVISHLIFASSVNDDPSPLLHKVLEEAPILRFLDWPDVAKLRSTSNTLKDAIGAVVESRVVDYFRPTSELVRVTNDILSQGGGWPRFVQRVLLPLLIRIEKRCRYVGVAAPLLYRVFWMRYFVRGLDGSNEALYRWEMIQEVRWYCDQSESKRSPYGGGWLNRIRGLDDGNPSKRLGCPDLAFYGITTHALFPDAVWSDDEEEDDDDDDSESEEYREARTATKALWDKSLPLYVLDDAYTFFGLTPPPPRSSDTKKAQLALFNCYEPSEAYGQTMGPFNILKLLLCFHYADFDPSDFGEIQWCDPGPRGLVLWYAFLVVTKVSPFVEQAENGLCPSALWKIVAEPGLGDHEERRWTEAFQYYSSLSLYECSRSAANLDSQELTTEQC